MIGYRSRGTDADRVVNELRAFGVKASSCAADIATREGAASLVDATTRELGGLDLFVANAGIWPEEEKSVGEMDDERWSRTMRENVDSMFFMCRAVARAITDGGRMVLVSSTAGQRGE